MNWDAINLDRDSPSFRSIYFSERLHATCSETEQKEVVATTVSLDQLSTDIEPVTKKDLHHRNGIEGTLSGLVRGQRMRRSRYRGIAKSSFQMKMTGAAANILRLFLYRQRETDGYHAISA